MRISVDAYKRECVDAVGARGGGMGGAMLYAMGSRRREACEMGGWQ